MVKPVRVSDANRPPDSDANPDSTADHEREAASDEAASDSAPETTGESESDLELDDVERLLQSDASSGDRPRRARRRSPWVSAIVIALSGYLLFALYPDFRYWLRSSEPEDLGTAATFVSDGRVPSGYHNTHVVLEGTPDVQYPVRLTTKNGDRYVTYLRIQEGGGQLFAAISRDPSEKLEFGGRFEGRMSRLGDDRAFAWLQQFYAQEQITRTIDIAVDAFVEGLSGARDGAVSLKSSHGTQTIPAGRSVRLVTEKPEVRIQLGSSSFTQKRATELMDELGFPYAPLQTSTSSFHSFAVRVPPERRESLAATLKSRAEIDNAADPKQGAHLLPMVASYSVPMDAVELRDRTLVFPYGDNVANKGHMLVDGRLSQRTLTQGKLELPIDELTAIRIEQPIELDPDGYLITVGERPRDARMWGLLWLVVLGLGAANATGLGLMLARQS
jgi:hypothetical protein